MFVDFDQIDRSLDSEVGERHDGIEADGRLVPDYDVKLGTILTEVNLDKPLPTMWKEFDSLAHLSVMVIRGGNSYILSAATVAAMQVRHPALQVVEVPDQGHAPLLAEADVIGRIAKFVAACDRPDSPEPVPMPDHSAIHKRRTPGGCPPGVGG